MTDRELLTLVEKYCKLYPAEISGLERLVSQLNDGEKLNDRRNFRGHAAGSGIVLSPNRDKVLLIEHSAYKRWLQPGGHWESDEEKSPLETAEREVEEETGLRRLRYLPIISDSPLIPIHLETHAIPARPEKNELAHYHHDFRYVFTLDNISLSRQVDEVTDIGWFDLDAPEAASIQETLSKLRRWNLLSI